MASEKGVYEGKCNPVLVALLIGIGKPREIAVERVSRLDDLNLFPTEIDGKLNTGVIRACPPEKRFAKSPLILSTNSFGKPPLSPITRLERVKWSL